MCKRECYYYTEIQDMGAHIPTCTRQDNLGVCPCNNCKNYILTAEVNKIINAYACMKEDGEQNDRV